MKIATTLAYVVDSVVVNTDFNATNVMYKLNMHNISDRATEALAKEFGIKAKKDDVKGNNINPKSKFPFKFFDDAGNEIDPHTIGNGSKAVVEITGSYDHMFSKQHGKAPIASSGVTVTELVTYTGNTGVGSAEEAL